MFFRALSAVCFIFVATPADAIDISLSKIAPDLPVSGYLSISDEIESKAGRVRTRVKITAPNFLEEMDAFASGRGNLGGCVHRLHWVGPTRFDGEPTAKIIRLTSRARYRLYVCDKRLGRFRTGLRDTKTIDFSLVPAWNDAERTLEMKYSVANIRNFPDKLEKIIRRLGVSFSGRTRVRADADEIFVELALQIHDWRPISVNDGKGLAIEVDLSADQAALRSEISKRLGISEMSSKLIGGALSLMEWRR